MFRVRAIQVENGDSLLISYGKQERPFHLLVDGGPSKSRSTIVSVLESVRGKDDKLRLEALVVTHYDLDHIQGVIELLEDTPPWLDICEVWFNGYHHLMPSDMLGSAEADVLSALIRTRGLSWNASFRELKDDLKGGAVIHQSSNSVSLRGGLNIKVLSPDLSGLAALAKSWPNPVLPPPEPEAAPDDLLGRGDEWPPKKFFSNGGASFVPDTSVPNRSSIALLLTFGEKRAVLAADAFCDVVRRGLEMHLPDNEPVHLLKVSHHGSKGNTSADLLEMLGCKNFLISTSGKMHKHPDHALIERLIASYNSPEIFFNYLEGWPGKWQDIPPNWPPFKVNYPKGNKKFVDVLL
ncbi:Metallo-beta-lactamase superfamily protein [Pseudomonas asplenii]|uniref:Metallo-beta-lactamase superfamily protein n=1 Tax=Pseudomonas asplenii TaxID=53407 RepID=A0A1H1ZJV7_9PSED|nr:MBL fold metallo-hydrolase [Pseudomonas asplenii]SDT33847.1 Metallo-beta-lactamase superfamily protein [Pseudomonas asplenii]